MARIMIADDSKSILIYLHEIIAIAGHEVIASSNNGTEALKNYFDYAPDLSILDNRMPNMFGLDVARHILEKNPMAKIILCSASFEEIHSSVKKLGLTLIPKPFSLEKMIESIDLILKE